MGYREGCRAGVQAVPQPNLRRVKGQAGQPDQNTCNYTDMRLVDGLNAILVMHARLGVLTVTKSQAKKP